MNQIHHQQNGQSFNSSSRGSSPHHPPPFELNPTIQCNDLKAFERRLMETILQQRPRERLWRILLAGSLGVTLISSYFWLADSMRPESSLIESLLTHYVFTVNCLILVLLLVYGTHRRVMQSNIIVNRIRQVLYDFALTCDDNGKLIIKQNYSRGGGGGGYPSAFGSHNHSSINSINSSSSSILSQAQPFSTTSSTSSQQHHLARRSFQY